MIKRLVKIHLSFLISVLALSPIFYASASSVITPTVLDSSQLLQRINSSIDSLPFNLKNKVSSTVIPPPAAHVELVPQAYITKLRSFIPSIVSFGRSLESSVIQTEDNAMALIGQLSDQTLKNGQHAAGKIFQRSSSPEISSQATVSIAPPVLETNSLTAAVLQTPVPVNKKLSLWARAPHQLRCPKIIRLYRRANR